MKSKVISYILKYLCYSYSIFILLNISHNPLYSQQFIHIQSPDSIHFIEDPITIQLEEYLFQKIKLYYSLDTGKTWQIINQPAINNTVQFHLPFTLSNKLQIKAVAENIHPLELIWENPNAHNGEVRATNFSPDGRLLLTLGKDGWIKIWDIGKKVLIDQLYIENNDYTYDAKFFHSNDKILFSSGDNAYLWNRNTQSVSIFYTIGNFIRKIDVHPKDNKFAVITDDNNLAVFQQTFLLPIPIFLRLYSNSTYKNSYSVRYSQSGNKLAIATFSGKAIITEATYFTQDLVLNLERAPIYCTEFCNNDQYLAYSDSRYNLNLYEFAFQRNFQLTPSFESTVRDIKGFKSNYLAAVSLDSTLRQWDLEDFSLLPVTIKEPFAILNLDLTSTGDTLATSGRNNAFRVWKNFSFDTTSQVIEVNIKQKIIINIRTDNYAYMPGDSCEIALLFNAQYEDTLSTYPIWHFQYLLHIPNKLFNIANGNFYPNDIALEKNNYDFLSDTFKIYRGMALFTDINKGEILIYDIEVEEPNNFAYIIYLKEISVLYFCLTQPPPKLSVSNKAFYITGKTEIEGNLQFDANLIEDGNFSVEIYSFDGKLLKAINQELKHGYYSFDIDLHTFSSGVYILKAQSVSETKYLKFLKL